MLQPRPGPSLHQLRRANRRWRGLALIALLGLVVVGLMGTTVFLIQKRQLEDALQELAEAREQLSQHKEQVRSDSGETEHGARAVPASPKRERKPSAQARLRNEQAARRAEQEQEAIAEVRRLGGGFRQDANRPGQPVVMVNLFGTQVKDGDLGFLEKLPYLEDLALGETGVTDGGLARLKGLTELQRLNLRGTAVTDRGLENLKGLTELHELDLFRTPITDKGLEQLKSLTNLQALDVFRTRVTAAGVQALSEALPKVKVNY